MTTMTPKPNQPIDLAQAEARLQQWRSLHNTPAKVAAAHRQWRSLHNTPAKVAAAHRKVLLERVSQSMAFENQPVSTDRLKALTTKPKAKAS
jgi:hypothetical protein